MTKHTHRWKVAYVNVIRGERVSQKEHCVDCDKWREAPYNAKPDYRPVGMKKGGTFQ